MPFLFRRKPCTTLWFTKGSLTSLRELSKGLELEPERINEDIAAKGWQGLDKRVWHKACAHRHTGQ